jgi:uncharacterized protein (DUF2384 family)
MQFSQFTDLAAELGLSQQTLSSWVGISSGSLNWARKRGTFKGDASSLLAGVQLMLDTIKTADISPDAVNFHHGRWLASWMEEPNPALGGVTPRELLKKLDDQEKVLNLLNAMLHGIYQ